MSTGVDAVSRPAEEGSHPPNVEATSKLKWLLVVCCVAQFLVILDLTIINVALPSIQVGLGFSATELQWVVDAYAIAFAGFLMLGGRATDYFGQRRTFVAALIIFAVASLIGGCAVDRPMLIAARAAQGFGGALMAAASLAIITSSFAAGPARHRAIGLWGAMNGAGGAAGALFGGIITQAFGWRWVLLINPPIAAAAAIVAWFVVADRRASRDGVTFDLAGAFTLTGGLVALVFGIVNAGAEGWTAPGALVPLVIGVLLLLLFPVIEARFASSPLVPPKAFTRPLRISNGVVFLFSAALFPMWYVSSLYLQQVLGLSPLEAGLTFFPMALTIMLSASRAGKLVGRFGVRPVLCSGLILMTSGMLLFTRIAPSGSALGYIVLPGILVAIGIGLSIVPSTIAATQGAGPSQAGLASGLVNTSRQMGGAIGIALLISLATLYSSHLIGTGQSVPNALTDGFRLAYLIGAGLVAAAGLVAFIMLPKPDVTATTFGARARLPLAVLAVVGGFVAVDFIFAGSPGPPLGAYTTNGAYSFASAPGLHPPVIRATRPTVTSKLAPGYIMVANFFDVTSPPLVGQSGPLLLDNRLQPVWFKPVPTSAVASNLSQQTYQGKPALAWWQGVVTSTGATESGTYVVVNQHYQTVATLRGQGGWILTLHSFQIQGNDAWVTANKNIPMDLSKYGGAKNGALVDSAVQEYDLRTGQLLYTWDALDHISLSDSHTPPPTNGFPWDAYHVNSISLGGHGTFLVSMRDTWAAYDVNQSSGTIEWSLGGKHSTYHFASGAEFEWQHDVVLESGSRVSLFDDHCCEITGAGTYLAATGPSRALVLTLNPQNHTAQLASQYLRGQGIDAAYMGNTELLAGGNVFVGWGALPYFSEYSASGSLLLDAVFPGPDLTYRATPLAHWVGLPLTAPSGAVHVSGQTTTVLASWNGATRVTSWEVLGGTSGGPMRVVGRGTKTGFQTSIAVSSHDTTFKVAALDAQGAVIGTSKSISR